MDSATKQALQRAVWWQYAVTSRESDAVFGSMDLRGSRFEARVEQLHDIFSASFSSAANFWRCRCISSVTGPVAVQNSKGHDPSCRVQSEVPDAAEESPSVAGFTSSPP